MKAKTKKANKTKSAPKKVISTKEANAYWTQVRNALKMAGAEVVVTGWHEDGFWYVHFDVPHKGLESCLNTLRRAGYQGSTTSKRFRPQRGDLSDTRRAYYWNVEAFLGAQVELE